jgi:hypothetical protein
MFKFEIRKIVESDTFSVAVVDGRIIFVFDELTNSVVDGRIIFYVDLIPT